jgi:hypothetical protein
MKRSSLMIPALVLVYTLPEPGGFKQKVEFNEFHPLEVAVLTSRNRKFCQDLQEDTYSNAWNQSFAAPPQMLKWIILTLFPMSMMFLRMTEKKLFGRKYSFSMLS